MLCPLCNVRSVAMTLQHNDSQYSMCHPCAIGGGFKKVVQACVEIDDLKQMWNLGEAVVDR